MDDENQETFARHAEAGRLIALARSMLNADRDSLAVTYLDLAVSAISSSNAVTAVNRRANGTPYRRAKGTPLRDGAGLIRSEEHTSELQSLMRISYAVFCLKKKK